MVIHFPRRLALAILSEHIDVPADATRLRLLADVDDIVSSDAVVETRLELSIDGGPFFSLGKGTLDYSQAGGTHFPTTGISVHLHHPFIAARLVRAFITQNSERNIGGELTIE